MRLAELKREKSHEQYKFIIEHEQIKLIDAVRDPNVMRVKTLCFIGNYANFATDGIVIRKFVYNFAEKIWVVSDVDLSDSFEIFVTQNCKVTDMETMFGNMFETTGYLLDSD